MAKVVVFGTSQWAELAHFYLTHDSPHDVVAFSVDRGYLGAPEFRGLPVVAFEELEQHYQPDAFELFIPLSFKRMNHLRAEKYEEAKRRRYRLISYVSSKATTWPGLPVARTASSSRTTRSSRSSRSATMWSCGAATTSATTR
jgi:hypothetical protein